MISDPVSALTGVTVNITNVRIFDENGVEIHNTDGSVTDPGITVNLAAGDQAIITGINDDYTVEWTTAGTHDGVLIHADGGKYDLGGFNLVLQQPTDDGQFDFSIQQTDYDGDVTGDLNGDGVIDAADDAFAFFSIGIDGTGVNDDDSVLLV